MFRSRGEPWNFSLDKVRGAYPRLFVPQGQRHRRFFEDKFYTLESRKAARLVRKESIFDKKVLIIPVNEEKHWTLIVVQNPRSIFEPQRPEKPVFLYLDSYKDPLYKALGNY